MHGSQIIKNNNLRLLNLDLIKIVAMFCVIALHSTYNYIDTTLGMIIYRTSVIAVPLFFLVSGYLVLGKNQINYRYIFNKSVGIIRFVMIITVLVWLFLGTKTLSGLIEITVGCLFQKGKMSVFWYLGAMLFLYSLTPFLNRLLYLHFNLFKIFLITLLLFSNTIFLLNYFDIHIEQNVIQTFRIWNWLLFYCLGGFIKKGGIAFIISPWFVALLLVFNILFQVSNIPFVNSTYCEYFYCSIVVQLLSVFIFIFFLSCKIKSSIFISLLSNLFLPVYTIHMFVIDVLNRIMTHFSCMFDYRGTKALIMMAFTIIISVATSWLIMRIPYLNKIFRI